MSTAPTVIKTTAELRELPVGSVIEVSAVGAISGDQFVIGCQSLHLASILRGGGSITPEGERFRATAPLWKGHSRYWNLGRTATSNFSDVNVLTYAEVTLKEQPPENPDDRVQAEMSPGLYPCTVAAHGHVFVLHDDGRWTVLNKETLHGSMTHTGPDADCVITQGASTRWLSTHRNADGLWATTTTLRKHALAPSPTDRHATRAGRVIGLAQ